MITLRPRYLDTWVSLTETTCTDACKQAWNAFLSLPCTAQHVVYGRPHYAFLARSRYLDTGYDVIVHDPCIMLCLPESTSSLVQYFGTVLLTSTPLHITLSTPDEYVTPEHAFYLFFFPFTTHSSIPVTVV